MYLKPDDFEVGMMVLGTVATFSHDVVEGISGTIATVTNQIWDHANKIYKITAIQLPYVVVELRWNEQQVCLGKRELMDTRFYRFMRATPEVLSALKVTA